VAVLETGEHNNADSFRRTYDKFLLAFTQPTMDYGYMSTPQLSFGGREVPLLRGRGLGGTSQMNFQVWSLGAKDEFDHWAAEVGDDNWAFDSILQRVRKVSYCFEL
jgi:choline dehydrogenase-like flavoprotein